MSRQRGPSLYRLALLLGGLFLCQLLGASRASAVQIFVESAFVHRRNSLCIVQQTAAGVLRFRCPPLPISVCCSAITGACNNADVTGCVAPNNAATGNAFPSTGPCESTAGGTPCAGATQGFGNISNDPRIEFDQDGVTGAVNGFGAQRCGEQFNTGAFPPGTSPFSPGTLYTNFCNATLFLCASVGYGTTDTNSDTAVDEMAFEVFKFQDGSNPLDEGSTPPLRTFFIDAPGKLPGNCTSDNTGATCRGPLGPFCVLFDGNVNIKGEQGKTNGTYGFRAKAKTNTVGASGNIQLTATRSYPSGATRDADFTFGVGECAATGCIVTQKPISVDVTNVHVVQSSPSLVGVVTPIPTQPYNIFYRLSKDATMFITINDSAPPFRKVRSVLNGIARVGEGTPQGTLTNGDSWNGRADNGDLMPPGVYLMTLQAFAQDQYGRDLSMATTRQIGLDILQITDIRVQPLLEGATALAVLDYVLTEPATSYIDIYPPATQFCNAATNLNQMPGVDESGAGNPPPKDFQPRLGDCAGAPVSPVKRIVEQKNGRVRVINFWDGRDKNGNLVQDGDFVFVMYAALPSQNGAEHLAGTGDRRIWTSQAKIGFIPVLRGFVGISQITPATTVVGSSPAVAGINPFFFRYSLSRDAIVNLKIFDATGSRMVKHLIRNEIRQGLFGHVERWDEPTGDDGFYVSSGSYIAQLTAADPAHPVKVSTASALFSVNLFRISDVAVTPLLSGASDLVLISYTLSQSMDVGLNIYPPGTRIINSSTTWPPCLSILPGSTCAQVLTPANTLATPVHTVRGLRAGRLRITEQWDGRDNSGLLVPDGNYVFTLAAASTAPTAGLTPAGVIFAADRIQGQVAVQRGQIIFPTFTVNPDVPQLFNSSSTITLHPFTINYSMTRQSSVTIQVLNNAIPPALVRTIVSGQVRDGNILLQDVWDGRNDLGNFPPAGFYLVRAFATDIASQLSTNSTAQVTISYDPLRIYDVAVSPIRADTGGSSIFYQVSEPMKTSVKIFKPGTVFDGAGNPNPPETTSLVKRIVGIKAARVQIEDIWDGTDLRFTPVPDGSYKFKIVGSIDPNAIDDLTGNVKNAAALSLDRPIDEIPVVRNASLDPAGDFERNTFVYPNPVTGNNATFQIYIPFQAKVKLRLFNIAGELVFEREFTEQAPSFQAPPLQIAWNKVNHSGRTVARGLYYAVVRIEETLGGKNVFQTVKKVLVP